MARKIDAVSFAVALAVLSSAHVEAQTAGSADDSNQSGGAQPALSATLQEVVVTARKRKEDIQNVPVSMVAIVGDQLTAQHVQSIDDIKASVPNLNIATSETPDMPDVVLRGIGSFDVTQAVGFYVDEVQQFQGSAVPFEDIARVEVLRGPQGTLYGGSNIGGAIKYVTKLPTNTFSTLLSVDGGGEGTRNYTAVISGPLIGDSLLGRFTYFNDHTDGFVYDTTLNERVERSDFRGGRLTLELKGDRTSAVAHLYFAELEGLSLDPLYIADSDHTYSTQVVFDAPPDLDHRTENADLHVEHQLGWATLTSVSAMTFANDFNFGDFDLSQYPISTGVTDTRERDYSQELRLTSSGNASLQWIAGLFYLHRNILFNQDFAQNLAPPPFVPTDFVHFFSYTDEFAVQEAAYANATYSLGRWSLEAGTRIEHDKDTVQVLPSNSNPAFAEESLANTVNLPLGSVSYHLTPHYVARPAAPTLDAAYLFMHGGAFVCGGGLWAKALAALNSGRLGCTVYSVDYRMPPEYPFPAAPDDCLSAYETLLREYPPHQVVIGGISAGGNLAAVTALRIRDAGLPAPAGVVLLTPEVDLTESGDTFRTHELLDVVLKRGVPQCNAVYANGRDLSDPYLSPLHANLSRFPPTLVQAGTRDLFLSNAVLFHRKLRRSGIHAELHIWEAMPHGGFGGDAPEDAEVHQEIRAFIAKVTPSGGSRGQP